MIKERFIERPVTEWEGVSIKVTVDVPPLSRTSQMIIDRRDMEQLRYLDMPDELKMKLESNTPDAQHELFIFRREHEQAKEILRSIADAIARNLCRAICKSLQEGK